MKKEPYRWAGVVNGRYTGLLTWNTDCIEALNKGLMPRHEWVYIGDMPEHVMLRRVKRGCRASVLRPRFDDAAA